MAHGFSVLNNNSQVLISNQTKTLHFVGKAQYTRLLGSLNQCGGMRCWQFTITCSSTPLPFFTMPTTDYYAVVGVRQTAPTTWVIEVLRSGTSTSMPEVYVFTDPNGIAYYGSETHGMRVYCDDGSVSFDSRLAPLVVTGGSVVAPPSSPINPTWYIRAYNDSIIGIMSYELWSSYSAFYNWRYGSGDTSGLYPAIPGDKGTGDPTKYLKPTQTTTYSISLGDGNAKPIYFFPSFAQSTRVTRGDYYPNKTYRCISDYWVLYRGGISFTGGVLKCGWVPYVQGNWWKAKRIDSGMVIGSGVDASSIVGAGAGGMPPYYNETLNLAGTPVIIANGARYD